MGDRFLELLLNGMKRLHAAIREFWTRHTGPPGSGRNGACTDEW